MGKSKGNGQGKGVSAGVRLAVSAVLGLLAALLTPLVLDGQYSLGVGWIVGCLVFLVWVWVTIWPMDAAETERHSLQIDPTRRASHVIVMLGAVVSLAAVGFYVIRGSRADNTEGTVLAGVGLLVVVLSWTLLHTMYTLRYANLYYMPKIGGITFNQDEPPCYRDFTYLASSVGMTYQVSDNSLTTPPLRYAVLFHSLLSFVFGVVILGATLNLVVGMG